MTLDEARSVEAAARPVARVLIATIVGLTIALPLAFRFAQVAGVRAVLTWAAPLLLMGLMALAWRLRRASPEPVDRRLLWAGTLAIAATAGFDVVITIIKDPELAIESNPFARMLLDAGHSVFFVKVYGATCQALTVAMLAVLLSAALAHAEPLRVLAWSMAPRTRKQFAAAAMRGTTNTSPFFGLRWRDWKSMKAHPWAVWMATVLCVGSCIGRTAIALEWLDLRLPPALRTAVVAFGSLVFVNAAWARAWRRGPPAEMSLATPDPAAPDAGKSQRLQNIVLWLSAGVILAGFLAAPEYRKAASVAAQLDEHIDALQREVTEGRDAAARTSELAADIERLEVAWDHSPASRVLPCKSDGTALLAEVRAIVEPLGMQLAGDHPLHPPRVYDFYDAIPIDIVMPEESGAAPRLAVALAGARRFLLLPAMEQEARARVILAYEYRCPSQSPRLEDHREPPWGRDEVRWPFALGVVRREREIERLREDRDRNAEALLLLRRQRFLAAELSRRESIADELARQRSVTE